MNKDSIEEMFDRWTGAMRQKASQYEHEDRKKGKEVFYPSLDDICNEMEAFLAGRKSK